MSKPIIPVEQAVAALWSCQTRLNWRAFHDNTDARHPSMCNAGLMPSIVASHAAGPETAERADEEIDLSVAYSLDVPWRAIVWNDPVNLMTYVVYVFQTYFGFTREKATRLMMQVHHDGKAVVATGTREAMEAHVHAMHGYGLTATLDRLES